MHFRVAFAAVVVWLCLYAHERYIINALNDGGFTGAAFDRYKLNSEPTDWDYMSFSRYSGVALAKPGRMTRRINR